MSNDQEKGELGQNDQYQQLVGQITETYDRGRIRAMQAVNTQLIETYWEIGRYIVEFEQKGEAKAKYGKGLIAKLSQDLTARWGKGFSRSNLVYMRLFYQRYPISQKPS